MIRSDKLVRMLQLENIDMTSEFLVKIERGIQRITGTQLSGIRDYLQTTYDDLLSESFNIRQCKWQLVRLRISQADCQASLWVPVYQKHFLSGLCQTYSQVRTGCCFANAAFLVGDGDDLCAHDFTSFLIVAVVSGNRKSRHFKIIK